MRTPTIHSELCFLSIEALTDVLEQTESIHFECVNKFELRKEYKPSFVSDSTLLVKYGVSFAVLLGACLYTNLWVLVVCLIGFLQSNEKFRSQTR